MKHMILLAAWLPAMLALIPSGTSASTEAVVDVSIRTIDGTTGSDVLGVCYIINGASNPGCDENRNGAVSFLDVQPGTYTVAQTRVPEGYQPVVDFDVTIAASPEFQQIGFEMTRTSGTDPAPTTPRLRKAAPRLSSRSPVPAPVCCLPAAARGSRRWSLSVGSQWWPPARSFGDAEASPTSQFRWPGPDVPYSLSTPSLIRMGCQLFVPQLASDCRTMGSVVRA